MYLFFLWHLLLYMYLFCANKNWILWSRVFFYKEGKLICKYDFRTLKSILSYGQFVKIYSLSEINSHIHKIHQLSHIDITVLQHFNSMWPSAVIWHHRDLSQHYNGQLVWHQASSNADLLLLSGPLATNFKTFFVRNADIFIEKIHLKMSANWQLFWPCLHVLSYGHIEIHPHILGLGERFRNTYDS